VPSGEQPKTKGRLLADTDYDDFHSTLGFRLSPVGCVTDDPQGLSLRLFVGNGGCFCFVSEPTWREQSEAAKDEAAKLPHGKLKNQLLREACQPKTASQINLGYHRRGYSRRRN
jgi:hypothetical protein